MFAYTMKGITLIERMVISMDGKMKMARVKRAASLLLAVVMVMTSMMFVEGIVGSDKAIAKEKSVYDYPTKKNLGKGYKFRTKHNTDSFEGIIYKNGKVRAKLKIKKFYFVANMDYVKKIGKKHYFNVWYGDGGGIQGLYTYKLGARKFKRVSKKVILNRYRHKGRYYAAYINRLPSDTSGFYMCIYNVKSNKRISLGKNVKDMYFAGKKLYYVKFSSNRRTARIFKCNPNGKNKKVIWKKTLDSPSYYDSYKRPQFMTADMNKKRVKFDLFNVNEYMEFEENEYTTLNVKYR